MASKPKQRWKLIQELHMELGLMFAKLVGAWWRWGNMARKKD